MTLKGSEIARAAGNREHADAIEAMLQQLLIALVKRAGGSLTVSVAEIDDTAGDMLALQLSEDRTSFRFMVKAKQ
ncbi:MAG: hypothetical protein AAGD13_00785 [Pseudomonadota bacterium]